MSEHEHETFETADAGASLTFPMEAGQIRKNGFIVIKGHPCKVTEVTSSKTGKHGHAKCHFVAKDIFTAKAYEDLSPSTHACEVPIIQRSEYTLIDINDEGFCTLMPEKGDIREDLRLPSGTESYDKLAEQLQEDFDAGKNIVVTVLKSMGMETINGIKAQAGGETK